MRKPKGFEAFDKLVRVLVQVPKSELSTTAQAEAVNAMPKLSKFPIHVFGASSDSLPIERKKDHD